MYGLLSNTFVLTCDRIVLLRAFDDLANDYLVCLDLILANIGIWRAEMRCVSYPNFIFDIKVQLMIQPQRGLIIGNYQLVF